MVCLAVVYPAVAYPAVVHAVGILQVRLTHCADVSLPLQDAAGVSAASPWRRAVATAERASLVAFRLLPHAALTVLVAAQPAAFATRARYGMATAGLLYMNLTNVLKARRTFGGVAAAGPKVKAG